MGLVATVTLKAQAKINWTLGITGRRADGYHLMDMLMQTVSLHDTLVLDEADTLTLSGTTADEFAQGGQFASGEVLFDESNLVLRAARLLQEKCHCVKGAKIHLEKHIPSGAGMGGGSADAAAALKGLNELWNLGLSMKELLALGLKLGADVPFMLTGGLAHVSGIGEVIEPLSFAKPLHLLMVKPGEGLSTGEIFHAFDALPPENVLQPDTQKAQAALIQGDVTALAPLLCNVLEPVSLSVRPQIARAKKLMLDLGAAGSVMTGSGSVVIGLFRDEASATEALPKLQSQAEKLCWSNVHPLHT